MANIEKRKRADEMIVEDPVMRSLVMAIGQCPDLISFDVHDPSNENLVLACAVDPGVAAAAREGWRGIVTRWWVGPYEVTDADTGEVATVPSLVLIPPEGPLVRLSGEPCIRSWARLIRTAGADRMRQGIRVHVVKRQSGVSGRSYWLVLPDA